MITILNPYSGEAFKGKSLDSIIRREHGTSSNIRVRAEYDPVETSERTIAVLRWNKEYNSNIVEAIYRVDAEDLKDYDDEMIRKNDADLEKMIRNNYI